MTRWISAAALAVVVAGALLYNQRARSAQPARRAAVVSNEAVPVTVARITRQAVRDAIRLVGVVRPDQRAAIGPKVPGRIVSVHVREGDRVRAGDLLAVVEIGDMLAQVDGARAGLDAAVSQERKAIAGREARRAELDAAVAEAQGGLRVAEARLKQAELGVTLGEKSAVSDSERASAGVQLAEAGLRQAEAGLALAEETVKRLRFLYARGGVAKADLEGAETQAAIARGQRDSALAGLAEARAAARPATESVPLRRSVSQADVEAARAGVETARQGLAAARRAREEALRIADRDIEAARAMVRQARAGVRQAQGAVGGSRLTSPIDGMVVGLSARPGEYAQPGFPLMTVTSLHGATVEVAVPVRLADRLRPHGRATVIVDGGAPVPATVEAVPAAATGDGRTMTARLRLPPHAIAAPGALAVVRLTLAEAAPALLAPADAVRQDGAAATLFVVRDGRAMRRRVVAGPPQGDFVQIWSGVREGEEVVVSPPSTLATGAVVRLVRP